MAAQVSVNQSELNRKIYEFFEYLTVEKGSSPLTIRNYKHYLSRFSDWIKNAGLREKLTDITTDSVSHFRSYLAKHSDGKGGVLSRRTQGYHVIALRSFLKWLIKMDYKVMPPDKIDLPKVDERQVKFLSGPEVDRLLNAPAISSLNGKRDKAILELLFSTGLRVSELAKLNQDMVDLDRREFGIIGKGGRARVVFLSSRAARCLKTYLEARKDSFKPLFIRHKGHTDPVTADEKMRLTVRSVQRMIKKYARKIKLAVDATPHVLRHSFATDLLMAGADIRSVQEMLGHKNISTTQIYTHVTNKQLREVHRAFHGKGR